MARLKIPVRREPIAFIKRLIEEKGLTHWRRYALAFALMAVAGGRDLADSSICSATSSTPPMSARISPASCVLACVAVGLFAIKGLATYGSR